MFLFFRAWEGVAKMKARARNDTFNASTWFRSNLWRKSRKLRNKVKRKFRAFLLKENLLIMCFRYRPLVALVRHHVTFFGRCSIQLSFRCWMSLPSLEWRPMFFSGFQTLPWIWLWSYVVFLGFGFGNISVTTFLPPTYFHTKLPSYTFQVPTGNAPKQW